MRVTEFSLRTYLKEVRGCGDEVTFVVEGHRTKRNGEYEHYRIELVGCRYAVTMLMKQIREMHKRDRTRIAQEQARITAEIQEPTRADG